MSIKSSEIALFLGKHLNGASVSISKPADLSDCTSSDIVWVKKFTPDRLEILESRRPGLVICDQETSKNTSVSNIVSQNTRLDFIRVMNQFFPPSPPQISIHPTAIIEDGASLGRNISIGAYCRIGSEVTIGDDTVIHSGVAIEGKVNFGRQCVIKANSVIGGSGFGFEYDENGTPIHFPHIGRIEIGDNVLIGACSTVEIGALAATVICDGCKIDDLVQVGHNVTVGKNTLIMANTIICGGSIIGEKCWIAPNSVVKEKIIVGNRVTIGLGSVVIRNIEDDMVVAGVPAVPIKPKNK